MADYLWWRDGVIYQIYPRSFMDSDGDGIGDLHGITSKLDYLVDLGVDAIWLSPINPSPDVDFGYDVADYIAIDPKYGTMQDFEELVQQAHSRGIRVILDLVLNHTSDQHAWFLESRSSKDNPKRDWYIWRPGKAKGQPPNQWQSVFGGKGWEYDEKTGEYYYHMFCTEQPDLNWRNPEVRAEMMDTLRFWCDREVDGFRLDVFNQYFKDAQFRDNPRKPGVRPFDQQVHMYDTNQPEMVGVVQEIRAVLDSYPERYAVGETFLADQKTAAGYSAPGMLHAAFDFSLLQSPFRADTLLKRFLAWQSVLDANAWPNNVLNNHDNPRTATRYHAGERDEKLKVAAAMLLTLRGTPFMYYGEEIGMRDIHLRRSEIQDPVGKRYWPFNVGRDGCRSPMQWTPGAGAGFTSGIPWLKHHQNHIERNVENQQEDPASLLNFYKSLLIIRRENPALQKGSFQPIVYDSTRIMAYLREDAQQTILVALNLSARPARLAVGYEISSRKWEILLDSRQRDGHLFEKGWLKLKGHEVCVLRQV